MSNLGCLPTYGLPAASGLPAFPGQRYSTTPGAPPTGRHATVDVQHPHAGGAGYRLKPWSTAKLYHQTLQREIVYSSNRDRGMLYYTYKPYSRSRWPPWSRSRDSV